MANMIPSANTITFNVSNIQRQYFYLPYPVTQHILWNANADVLNKLYKTCKFFYKKRPYCIVDEMHMDGPRLLMNVNNTDFHLNAVTSMAMMDNIWVTKNVMLLKSNEALMSKIVRCDANKILVNIPTLSMKDFMTFTQSGAVKYWFSPYTNIIDYDGNPLSLDKFLFQLPNSNYVNAEVHYVVHQSPLNMASIPRKHEIKHLSLRFDHPFNADLLFDLLKKTLAPNAHVHLWLNDEDAKENFKAEMDAKLDSWIPQSEKPILCFC